MELTINNLIKIAIGVLVLVIVIGGLFFAMKSYVLPYFAGIGFEESTLDINSQFGRELIKEENKVAMVGVKGFLIIENDKKMIVFKKDNVYEKEYAGDSKSWVADKLNPDHKIGRVTKERRIEIDSPTEYFDLLNGAYYVGTEIYKIGGVEGETVEDETNE